MTASAWCVRGGVKRHSSQAIQVVHLIEDHKPVQFCLAHVMPCTGCGARAASLTEVDKSAGAGRLDPVVVLCRSCLLGRTVLREVTS